jgi:hypothetical protein
LRSNQWILAHVEVRKNSRQDFSSAHSPNLGPAARDGDPHTTEYQLPHRCFPSHAISTVSPTYPTMREVSEDGRGDIVDTVYRFMRTDC